MITNFIYIQYECKFVTCGMAWIEYKLERNIYSSSANNSQLLPGISMFVYFNCNAQHYLHFFSFQHSTHYFTFRFLRSISYREFCRLVYGWLGSKRIPLPACAYSAIRAAFPVTSNETGYTGFEMDDWNICWLFNY